MIGLKSVLILVIAILLAKNLFNIINIRVRRRSLARKSGCKPVKTYEQSDKWLGLLFLYRNIRNFQARTFLQSWEQYLTKTGKTFEFWTLGQRLLVTSDPENLKTILATSFDDFEKGPQLRAAFAPLFGNGIFAADGEEWHQARALLRPSFAKSEMNDTRRFETHYQCFLRMLPADGVAIDLQELLNRLTMDTATDLLYGSSTGSLAASEDAEARRFSSAADIALKAAFRDVSIKSLSRILDRQNSKGARDYLHKTVDRYVQEALTKRAEGLAGGHPRAKIDKEGKYVFLEHLMERTKDAKTLRDQSLSALFGGRETTASLLSNLLYVLARRPDLWGKLRREALHVCDEPLDQERMKDARCLSHCISESLRLHPVVPINTRWCNKDTVLPRGGGADGASPILVPKGTQVYLAVYQMQRDREHYGHDAHEFKPERWEKVKPGWSYVPFSAGPRLCVGQQLALTETTYTMLRMLQMFRAIAPADEEPWRENFSITLACASGCKVRLYRA